jgi:inosose dehydratase
MTIRSERVGINPLQWVASADGWIDPSLAPPLSEQLAAISAAGFQSLYTSVPDGFSAEQYRALLGEYGLSPAPGYIPALFTDDDDARKQLRDRAERTSAQHAELGVPVLFLALGMAKDAERVAHPAVGYAADTDRLKRARDLLVEIAELVRAAGVTPAFHPHVGTWAETEQEARFVLDTVDADLLAFGPDTGHLGWAGADVPRLIADYADRVASVHIKDYHAEIAARGKTEGWDYRTTVRNGLWAEPGQASADLDSVIAALPADFDGWLIIEVDRGAQATPAESIRLCGEWARSFGTSEEPGRKQT